MIEKLLRPELQDLIAVGDFETFRDIIEDWEPADLAALVDDLSDGEQLAVFRNIDNEVAAAMFAHLDLAQQYQLITELPYDNVRNILNAMSPDDRTALLEGLPDDTAEKLMRMLTREERTVAETLLSYPENSVGRLMTPDFLALKPDWTVRQVLDYIRRQAKNIETLDWIYVVDDDNRLIDDIRIQEFLIAPLYATVRSIMDNQYVQLSVMDDQESAIEIFRKYDRTVLPVVDQSGVMVGIVTVDDVLDVVEEEATEDIQKFGGQEALDEPYIDTPMLQLVKKRATWLVVLFVGEMMTATAMQYFEEELARAIVLASFVPLIISSGGNSGSQAATLIIRALALGEVRLRDWWIVMRRELFSGAMLGVILGTIGFCRIAVWHTAFGYYPEHWMLLGIVVGLSLVCIVLFGTIVGSMLPFILKRLGLDPATSSAPFVATLVDVTGLVIYFTIALMILQGKML